MKNSVSSLFALTLLAPAIVPADEITMTPAIINVGKWPEGLALIGESLWVAESGDRALAKYEAATGTLIERLEVGRLPVHLATAGDTFFATINTDKKIWQQALTGPGKAIGTTGADAPEAIATGAGAVQVLLHLNGSSQDTAVMRLDPASGATTRSPSLGANATDLTIAGDHLWVISNPVVDGQSEGTLSRLNPETLEVIEQIPVGGRLWRLAESQGLLFAGVAKKVSESFRALTPRAEKCSALPTTSARWSRRWRRTMNLSSPRTARGPSMCTIRRR